MNAKPWTDHEIGFLQDHADWSGQRLADELGRTVRSIKGARHSLKNGTLGGQVKPRWTEDEDAVILDAHPSAPAKAVAKLLPGRSSNAVEVRRRDLGIGGQDVVRQRATDIAGRPLVAKTCTRCGLLLAGSWFRFNKATLKWASDCRACASKRVCEANRTERQERPDRGADRSRRLLQRMQQVTRERAERHGEPYTEADYETLADTSLTDFQKALRLKRSYSGVKNARRAAGLKSMPQGLGDPERDIWVIDNPNAQVAA
jgi:hypothetical protein